MHLAHLKPVIPTEAPDSFIVCWAVEGPPYFAFTFSPSSPATPPRVLYPSQLHREGWDVNRSSSELQSRRHPHLNHTALWITIWKLLCKASF